LDTTVEHTVKTLTYLHKQWSLLLFVALVISGLLLKSFPLWGGAEINWQSMSAPLLSGTFALVLVLFWAITLNFSARVAGLYLAVAVVFSWLAEVAGAHYGVPFGATYRYHSQLSPQLPGDIPLFILLDWFVLSGWSLIMLRGTVLATTTATLNVGALVARSLLSGVCVAGCDLVLDPLATSVKAWTWTVDGPYFGIPLSNFLGWVFVGTSIHLIASLLAERLGLTVIPAPRWFARVWVGANLGVFVVLVVVVHEWLPNLVPLALATSVVGPFFITWWCTRDKTVRLVESCPIR